jgi:hypothetical protein
LTQYQLLKIESLLNLLNTYTQSTSEDERAEPLLLRSNTWNCVKQTPFLSCPIIIRGLEFIFYLPLAIGGWWGEQGPIFAYAIHASTLPAYGDRFPTLQPPPPTTTVVSSPPTLALSNLPPPPPCWRCHCPYAYHLRWTDLSSLVLPLGSPVRSNPKNPESLTPELLISWELIVCGW